MSCLTVGSEPPSLAIWLAEATRLPEVGDRSADLIEQFDIDAMVFLNPVIALDKQFGFVPDADYPRLASLSGAVPCLVDSTP